MWVMEHLGVGGAPLRLEKRKMTKSYIKEAEQNVINQAKFWHEFLEFVRSMELGINNATDRWSPGREKFAQAFDLLRQAAYTEQQHAMARCFALVGVGGEAAEQFAKERARKIFSADRSVVSWLDSWNRLPSSWMSEDEEGLRTELKGRLK